MHSTVGGKTIFLYLSEFLAKTLMVKNKLRKNNKLKLLICIPGEGSGNPLQYSCLENPMDGGAWLATVHEVAKSQTWLFNMYTWKIAREKCVTQKGGFEFRLNYHINMERAGGDVDFLGKSKWSLQKMNELSEHGKYTSLWQSLVFISSPLQILTLGDEKLQERDLWKLSSLWRIYL